MLNQHSRNQHELITPKERSKFKQMIEIFDSAEQSELIIMDNSKLNVHNTVVKLNTMFLDQFEEHNVKTEFTKYNEILFNKNGSKINNIEELLKCEDIAFE